MMIVCKYVRQTERVRDFLSVRERTNEPTNNQPKPYVHHYRRQWYLWMGGWAKKRGRGG